MTNQLIPYAKDFSKKPKKSKKKKRTPQLLFTTCQIF